MPARPRRAPPVPATQDQSRAVAPDGFDRLSAALEAVVVRYEKLLRYVAARHGVSAGDLREVVQEVRVRLWRARPASETIAALGVSYVYRTAISAALEVVRRHRSTGGTEGGAETRGAEAADRESATPAADGPEQQFERSELARTVAEEVRALADARRVAVQLYLVGYSREEIASTLGWSQAKARNLIYRGLADLRAALTRRGIGPEDLS
jgi:RNA polymerase sigma-70 factor (ECF subfamily)